MTETDISSSELKKEIRRKMLALRRALSDDEAEKKADCLTEQILSLPEYKKAKRIMAFLAMKGESNLDRLIALALSEGKEVYVPVCLPERQMEAGRLLDMDHFVKGPLGLRDLPKGYDTIAPEELDAQGKSVPGFTITYPRSAELSSTIKASRILNLSFTARLAGAIHVVEISGALAYEL